MTAAGDTMRRVRRSAWLGVLMLVLAGVAGLSAGAARGDASLSCSTTITTQDGTPVSSVQAGTRLVYTITVTSSDPTALQPGLVNFWSSSQDQVGDDGELDTINGSTGTGSITTASLQAGTYQIVGHYRAYLGGPECYTQPVPLTIGAVGPTKTQTSIQITPTTVDRNGYVTMTATVSQIGNPEAPVGGNVIFSTADAHFGDTGGVPLQGNTATLTTPIQLPAGTYTVEALYVGDLNDNIAGSSATTTLVVRDNSFLAYHGDATVQAGKRAMLGATLTDRSGAPIVGQTITLAVQNTTATCTGVTDSSGAASCSTTVDAAAGSYTVLADYAGNDIYKATQAKGSITVLPGPTSIAYIGDTHGVVGREATLSAVLTTAEGAPIGNATISLAVAGHPSLACTPTTNASGSASCTLPVTAPTGMFEVDASYAGSPLHYIGSSDSSQSMAIIVSVPTSLTYVWPTATQPAGTAVAPEFRLTDDSGNPVPNAAVSITFDGATSQVTTGPDGIATAPAESLRLGGTYPVSATFAGALGFDPSAPASGTVTVAPAATTLTLAPVAPILAGTTATLAGKLVVTADGLPLADELVTLSADGYACTASTGADGVATCTTTTAIPGPARDVVAHGFFAGDARASGSSADGAGLVYSYAPGGGIFVIGDKTPLTSTVTFWGSRWWKVNTLTGGSPSTFKGYAAATPPTTCGAAWTSRTGNSTPPPVGPLPKYMAVVVSSSIAQAGSTIRGDVTKIVIVATDPGYAGNPGHSGTGAVVTTICGG